MKNSEHNSLKIRRASLAVLLAVGSAAFVSIAPVRAQDATLPTKEVNITLNQAPVRTALDTLFKSAGLNYTIDPAVTGLVTVSLRAIPFDVALRSILRSSQPPLAFTVEDGVYNIHPRVETTNITTLTTASAPPVQQAAAPTSDDTTTQVIQLKLNYANAALILRYALAGTGGAGSGYIPSLDAPPTSGSGSGGRGSTGGQSGIGGQAGGFGGGGGGYSSGGSMSGGGGFSTGGGSTGGFSSGGF